MTKITALPVWQALKNHKNHLDNETMLDWFRSDSDRFSKFSLTVGDLFLDYSKNRISPKTILLLTHLADSVQLKAKIEHLFNGQPVNSTEKRAALHTALRDKWDAKTSVDNTHIAPAIHDALAKMRTFTDKVRAKKWLGATGKPITDIVNIGIGGSHLGPLTTTHALSAFATKDLHCHFISNVDAAHLLEVIDQIDLESTLFIVSSKSFTTLETTTNAITLKNLLSEKIGINNIAPHFVAITSAENKAIEFGIPSEQIFPLWDWIGGRYSIWSAIGLPLAIMIGMDNFEAFLEGAHEMDLHFRHAEFSENMPVLLALLGIWYINFFGANNHAIVPYSHYLTHLRMYLQQADMESNGKNISHSGMPIDYATGPIIWGEQGCNAQHAFHQLLHQGQHFIPVDFILVGRNKNNLDKHHDILVASGLSQAQALLQGKSFEQALNELIADGYSADEAKRLAQHKCVPGNRPSNILLLKAMTPKNLGALLALYEHKIFVQGVIWDINSFDQWGVELGKLLLPQILNDLTHSTAQSTHDSSTQGLINYYRSLREMP